MINAELLSRVGPILAWSGLAVWIVSLWHGGLRSKRAYESVHQVKVRIVCAAVIFFSAAMPPSVELTRSMLNGVASTAQLHYEDYVPPPFSGQRLVYAGSHDQFLFYRAERAVIDDAAGNPYVRMESQTVRLRLEFIACIILYWARALHLHRERIRRSAFPSAAPA